jgi:hypothetical protein
MLSISSARRLLRWTNIGLPSALLIMLLGAALAYAFDPALPMPVQIVGHALIGLSAFAVKTGYVARLAALDVLDPRPFGEPVRYLDAPPTPAALPPVPLQMIPAGRPHPVVPAARRAA